MGHSTSVSDHIQPLMQRLKMFIQLYFHIVEFHFHSVKQCIIICSSRCDLIQGIDHFNDAI